MGEHFAVIGVQLACTVNYPPWWPCRGQDLREPTLVGQGVEMDGRDNAGEGLSTRVLISEGEQQLSQSHKHTPYTERLNVCF